MNASLSIAVKEPAGVKFNRLDEFNPEKDKARWRILEMLGIHNNEISILTMPCEKWKFEHLLLERIPRARIYSVEMEKKIYNKALNNMPGRPILSQGYWMNKDWGRCSTQVVDFSRCTVEAYIDQIVPNISLDFAWIDLSGPLTAIRIHQFEKLLKMLNSGLVITCMESRYDQWIKEGLAIYGSTEKMMAYCLNKEPIDVYRYRGGRSPMVQMTWFK